MTAPEHSIEQAADDLLLLFAQVETANVPLPTAVDVLSLLTSHVSAGMASVTRYVARHPTQEQGVQFGHTVALDGLLGPAASYLALSLRLLAWSSSHTGRSHAEVVAAVLAVDDHLEVDKNHMEG